MRKNWPADNDKICCVQKEILEEVVRELQKVKEEIIDGKFKDLGFYARFQFLRIFTFFSFSLAIRRELLRIGST